MSDVLPIIVPQLNANDETVRLVEWLVSHGQTVSEGDSICEVETSKAVTELFAEHPGVIYHIAPADTDVRVGETIGAVGPSLEEVQAYLEAATEPVVDPVSNAASSSGPGRAVPATPRARALASELGISLESISAAGVRGSIKETDVRRYASEHASTVSSSVPAPASLPLSIAHYVVEDGPLSQHEKAVAAALRQSQEISVSATIDAEIDLSVINPRIRDAQERGVMLSLLHLAIKALGSTLPNFPRLASFHDRSTVYRYRELDIAFAVKAFSGNLYAPVIRAVDQLDVEQIARACYSAAVETNRGHMDLKDLEGACFTVSHLPVKAVTRFVALPNQFQSAILAIAAERQSTKWVDGVATPTPVAVMTLTYDHTLCDGMYAAEFMQRLIAEMESALQ